MAFPKDKLHEELKKQVEVLIPAMRKLNFTGGGTGPYWDEFSHRSSGVNVKVIPIKERNHYGSYEGFKLKVTRGYYVNHSSRNTVLLKIDNLDTVKKTVLDSIRYRRSEKKSERENRDFKGTLEKTLPRLFPGRVCSVYEGRGEFSISVPRKGDGPWFDIKLSRSGQISGVTVNYPGKDLPEIAKALEAW